MQLIKEFNLLEYVDRRFVNIEGIFVLTNGTFEKPKAKAAFAFNNSDELIDFISVIKGTL